MIQRGREVLALLQAAFPRNMIREDLKRAAHPGRAVRPDSLHQIILERHQRRMPPQILFDPRDPGSCMQPGIIANDSAARGMGLEPLPDASFRTIHSLIEGAIDLLRDLQHIAPVGEGRGFILQHHSRPRRSGKVGEPFEALLGRVQKLPLIAVGLGHQIPVQFMLGYGLAQLFEFIHISPIVRPCHCLNFQQKILRQSSLTLGFP